MGVAITKVSSRGQIVVPADLRKDLELLEGNKLLIYTKDKTLVVKKISEPVMEKTFEEIVEPIRQKAKKAMKLLNKKSRLKVIKGANHHFGNHKEKLAQLSKNWFQKTKET